jgi:DNA-binding NarL/FixJ family response regulator
MPGEDLARQILAEFPRTRIVAITSAQGHKYARRALDAGVHGYLSKAAPVYELVQGDSQGAGRREDDTRSGGYFSIRTRPGASALLTGSDPW